MTGDAQHRLKVFVSYHHDSREFTKALVDDIEDYRHDVWFDHDLVPGEEWWQSILDHIRCCDVFFFIADQKSIESAPCRREVRYALDLKKPVVTVVDTGQLAIGDLPAYLQKLEIIDIGASDPPYRKQLTRLLVSATKAPPLEPPLPAEPELPISPLAVIADRLKDATELREEEQVWLVHQLKRAPPKDAEQIGRLLAELRQRPETRNIVQQEIDNYLRKLAGDRSSDSKQPDETARGGRVMKVVRILPQIGLVIVVVVFVVYKIIEESGPFSKHYSRDTLEIRSMIEQLDDPDFPNRVLLTAHEELEDTRAQIIREHRLDEVQTRPVDQDFAAWHIALANAARLRGIPAVVDLNLEIAEQLAPDASGIRELRRHIENPSPGSVPPSEAAPLARGRYEFRIVEIGVVENGDGWLFGKTDAYLTMAIGDEVVTPKSFPSVDGTSLRIGDNQTVSVGYPFLLDVGPDTYDAIVHFRLHDRDSKNADAPHDNQLIGHFDVRMSELIGMSSGQKLTLDSLDLAVGSHNATLVLTRLE